MKEIWERFEPEGKHLLWCFLAVLALTLFARGYSGAAQPRVTTLMPQSRTMTGEVYTSGTLTPLGNQEYPVPDGLVITALPFRVGDTLADGDPVALVDAEALEDLLTRKGAELKQMELRLEELLDHTEPSDDALAAAKDAHSEAKELRKEWEKVLSAAKNALELAPEAEKETAQAAVAEAEAALKAAKEQVTAAKKALSREEKAYEEAVTRARRERENNEAQASVLELDIAAARSELEALEAVLDADCCILAPADGILAELSVSEEMQTADAFFAMTNPYGGLKLSFPLDREDAGFLTARTKITISREEQTKEIYGCTPDETGQERTIFTVPVTDAAWEAGQVGVHIVLWSEDYDTCVPVTALRQDGDGYFVYVLARSAGLWDIHQTIRRVGVQVERVDGVYAAVLGVEPGMQIVDTSSRPLTDGSRVRVMP